MVLLSQRAYLQMTAEIAAFDDLETGGFLLGWRDGDNTKIMEAVCGGVQAVRERCGFEPDPAYAAYEISLLMRMYDERELEVLGVWHKHNHDRNPPFSESDRTMHLRALESLQQDEIVSLLFQKTGDARYRLAAYIVTTEGESGSDWEITPRQT